MHVVTSASLGLLALFSGSPKCEDKRTARESEGLKVLHLLACLKKTGDSIIITHALFYFPCCQIIKVLIAFIPGNVYLL